jgi:A/G-specific adenine glycosylase
VSPFPAARELARLRRAVRRHYATTGRDFPWRRTRDPYRILVSEVMLQQTTTAAVVPYYQRFVARFPDLTALAAASDEEVLTLWSGLGYYRRARHLRRACAEVASRYAGRFPRTYAALLELPGVGPYTAAAVASICFGKAEPALDGNMHRVLCRLAALPGRGKDMPGLREFARRLVDTTDPASINQGLMDLGATICVPRSPRCPICPIAAWCRAARTASVSRFPAPRRRPALERRRGAAVVLRRGGAGGAVLLVRRPAGSLMPGLWQLPGITGFDALSPEPTPARLARAASRQAGRPVRLVRSLGRVSHVVLSRRVDLEVWEGRFARAAGTVRGAIVAGAASGRNGAAPGGTAAWQALGIEPLPLTAAARKALRLAGIGVGSAHSARRPAGRGAA